VLQHLTSHLCACIENFCVFNRYKFDMVIIVGLLPPSLRHCAKSVSNLSTFFACIMDSTTSVSLEWYELFAGSGCCVGTGC